MTFQIRFRSILGALCILAAPVLAQEITVVTGKIKTFERADPAQVVISTGSGDLYAELAPVTFLEEQKLVFNPGAEITVRGFEETRGGRRTVVVTEVTTRERPAIRLRRDDRSPVWIGAVRAPGGGTELTVVKGKVKMIEKKDPVLVTVTTESGDYVAELAPETFLEEQKILLEQGAEITLRGFEDSRGDRRTLVVTEVTTRERPAIRLRREDRTPVWNVRVGQGETQIRMVKGKIKTFEKTGDPASVTLVTDEGEIFAELAPPTFLEEQKLVFNTDEEITLRGFEESRSGRRTLVVTEVTTRERPAIRLRREDRSPVWIIKKEK